MGSKQDFGFIFRFTAMFVILCMLLSMDDEGLKRQLKLFDNIFTSRQIESIRLKHSQKQY